MTRFATAKHLAAWAGVCPGHHESADCAKNTKVRPGNPYLKGAIGLAAFGAVGTKDTHLAARCKRLTARRGSLRALVAVGKTRAKHRARARPQQGALHIDPSGGLSRRHSEPPAAEPRRCWVGLCEGLLRSTAITVCCSIVNR
ncbi:transposase [Streptomyces sp. NPDC088748]|uniref:transposase n=1 Tax=Streptomyces sp. NPDC088748 TaxID=3365887 RepID=UPI0037FBA78B